MSDYKYTNLAEIPSIKDKAAEWFHSKWGVPKEAYLECMDAFLNGETDYGWYLCLDNNKICNPHRCIPSDVKDQSCHNIVECVYSLRQAYSLHLLSSSSFPPLSINIL